MEYLKASIAEALFTLKAVKLSFVDFAFLASQVVVMGLVLFVSDFHDFGVFLALYRYPVLGREVFLVVASNTEVVLAVHTVYSRSVEIAFKAVLHCILIIKRIVI